MALAHMLPLAPGVNHHHARLSDAELRRDRALCQRAIRQHPLNLSHLSFGQFGARMRLPARRIRAVCVGAPVAYSGPRGATLSRPIRVVVSNGAEKQVARIAAAWVVAGVADTVAIWNWAVRQFKRHPMRAEAHLDVRHRSMAEGTVTARVACPSPRPAGVVGGLVDSLPEVMREVTPIHVVIVAQECVA